MNSQQHKHQKTQDDHYSNLNPKPRPEKPRSGDPDDPVRNPDPDKGPTQTPQEEPGTYPAHHPSEVPSRERDPNEFPFRRELHGEN